MNKLHSIMAMLVTILFSMPSFAQNKSSTPKESETKKPFTTHLRRL